MRFDPNNPPEFVEFNGVRYRRMGGARKYYLSQSTTNAGRKNPKGLHVAIWEFYSGKQVPPGHEVNHKDRDTFNFDYENLECLPKGVHRALPKVVQDKAAQLVHLENIRGSAAAWHGSRTGRKWHRTHASNSIHKPGAPKPYSKVVPQKRICEWCGSDFNTKHAGAKCCGEPCKTAKNSFLRGKNKRCHPHYAARLQSDGG